MQSQQIFFVVYIILALLVFPKSPFIKKSGLTSLEIRILLTAKILISIASAYYFVGLSPLSDSVAYNIEGKIQYDLLISNPAVFFSEFKTDIDKYGLGNIFSASDSFWGYLRFHLIYKLIAFFNFLSAGNFYFNSVIFSSIVFFGNISFYRIFNEIYPGRKFLKLFVCFFLPAMALYTSCVHKDGLVFLCIGISSYIFYRSLLNIKDLTFIKAIVFLCSLFCIFLFRNYVLVALLPAMTIAFIAHKLSRYKIAFVFGMYFLATIIFFSTGFLSGSYNLPAAVINRKADFAQLEKGNTDLPMKTLEPNALSFAKSLPQAIEHVMLRPYPTEVTNKGTLIAFLELYFYLALIITSILISRKKSHVPIHPFNIYGFAFFTTMVFIIGFTIPNIGAIVRYRSILWIFILCPLVCNIPLPLRWQRFLN